MVKWSNGRDTLSCYVSLKHDLWSSCFIFVLLSILVNLFSVFSPLPIKLTPGLNDLNESF